ncbi:Chromate transport protein [compost metagenome]
MNPATPPSPPPVSPTLPSFVGVFARIGVTAFGGGVTSHLLQHLVRRGWLDEREYLEAVNWCQNLPGPNATNLSAYLGFRFFGGWGALLSTVVLVVPGALMVLALDQGLGRSPAPHIARGALDAVAAAAVGLLLGMVWQLAKPALTDRARVAVAVVTAGLVALAGVPTPLVIVGMVAVVWALDSRRLKRIDTEDAP